METAVIVIPYHKKEITPQEEISFKQLRKYLGHFEKVIIGPEGLNISQPDCKIMRFSQDFFVDKLSYSRLMLSKPFYESFLDYRYILIYQLDCLVFSDQLLAWCDEGFDYIGAPWLKDKDNPQAGFSRVGNGGFSLRKVESFLRILNHKGYYYHPREYWRIYFQNKPLSYQLIPGLPQTLTKFYKPINSLDWYLPKYNTHEDFFWSDQARRLDPGFKVAPVEKGLSFSFERAPEYCYIQNHHQLPFGCHAWVRYDQKFWEPFIQQ
jgi:hypothetical protein